MLFLLQEAPAETTNYMIAGYTVIFGVILLYLLSLYIRQRNLKQELEILEEDKQDMQ
jgi:CcmD family protein